MALQTEVAVVGAGPAGLGAAYAAMQAGCAVTLIDSYARPGGQYYKQMPSEFQARSPGALHHRFGPAQRLMPALQAHSKVTILTGTTVWSAQAADSKGAVTLYLNDDTTSSELHSLSVVLAPGAFDRALPFPGWDLPGVMTAGAIQSLVKSQRVLPGRRIVLSGSGPFLMPVAAALAQAGAQVLGVYEATHPRHWVRHAPQAWGHWDKLREALDYAGILRKYRVPVKFGRAVVRAEGDGRVRRVAVARLDAGWSPIAGSEQYVEVDTLGLGYGFVPSIELAQLLGCALRYDPLQAGFFVQHDASMESSRKGVFVAGEIAGIGGSSVARPQGAIAGLAAARKLGRLSAARAREAMAPHLKELHHQQAFARLLHRLYPVPKGWFDWLTPETIICRCEEVSYARVKEAVTQFGATDAKTVKNITRCGMGLCQGRVCGSNVAAITSALSDRPPEEVGTLAARPIVKPVMLGAMIHEEVT
jgi:NADPH-dependent 2,4-dienoyl-CoA reductase/sulfur reductase-like enzyme